MSTQNTINSHPDDIIWNPPATLYIYCADLYCPDCAKGIERDLIGKGFALCQGMDDSDSWPVPYSRGEGESDTPDHCGKCSRFLGRNLTDDGTEYVKESAKEDLDQHGAIGAVVQGWLDFYGIKLDGHYSGPHHPTKWCNTMCPDCESLWVSKMEIDLDI